MQAESLVTVVILTDQFGVKLIKCLQSVPTKWPVLICSPFNQAPNSIKLVHPRIQHFQLPEEKITNFAQARNQALQQVKTKWACFLDSDEVIENFEQQQVETLLNNQQLAGLSITRSDVFFGQRLQHGEAGHQSLTRLVRVERAHFLGKVHEVAMVEGQVASSGISISHFSHDSIGQFITQVSRYAYLSTELHSSKLKLRLLLELLFFPPLKFLLNYFVKLGFLDGWRGLVYALIMSLHSTLVRLMTWDVISNHSKHADHHPELIEDFTSAMVSGSSNLNSLGSNYRFKMLQLGLSLGLLILLPFGQLLRWSLTNGLALYPHDLILSWLVILSLIALLRQGHNTIWQKLYSWRWEVSIWSYFWILGAIKLLLNGDPNQFLIISRLGVYALGILISLKSLNHCRLKIKSQPLPAKHLWIVGLSLFAWLSFILYLIFPDMRSLVFFGWDDHYFRLIGTLFDPNYTGIVLSVGLLMTLDWLTFNHQTTSSIGHKLLAILTLFFAVCLGLTFSRSSWLSLIIATTVLIVVALLKKQFDLKQSGLIVVIGSIILASVILAPKPGGEGVDLSRSASVSSRLAFDQYILQALEPSDLLFGKLVNQPLSDLSQIAQTRQPTTNLDRSTNSLTQVFHPKTANNLFVTSLLWGGVIGLTLVILLSGKWLWQLYKSSPIALSILIAWLVHAQFNNSFLEPFVFLFVGGSILSLGFEMLDPSRSAGRLVQHDELFKADR